jgi:hypothetical protein
MRDVAHRVEPRHVLLLQEIDRVALALGEQRHQHVRPRDLVAAGGLHVIDGALDHALEARGGLGVLAVLHGKAAQLLLEVFAELAAKLLDVDIAGAQHGPGIVVVAQRQQQMLQRRVLVMPLVGIVQRAVQALFKFCGKRGHWLTLQTFSMVHCSGCWCLRAKSTTCTTLVSATS